MSTYSSADVAFFQVNGRDLKGVLTKIDDNTRAVLQETHGFGVSWPAHSNTGIKEANLAQSGWFDDAADSVNAALNEQQGLAKIISLGLAGNTSGRKFIGYSGPLVAQYDRTMTKNEMHQAAATYKVSGAVYEGVILQTLATKAANWDSTGAESVDNGASSANGLAAVLQIGALTLGGYTSVTVKVRHSADDITYVDLITFDAVTTGFQGQVKTVAGTVNRHLGTTGTLVGSGSGPSIVVSVGAARLAA